MQQLINGLFLGSVYALFALGYTLVFGILDILNLAHAAVFMLGAFAALVLVTELHVSVWLALAGSMVICALLGVLLERVAFAPLRRRPDTHLAGLITSIAMALMFEAFALWRFEARTSRYPTGTYSDQSLELLGATVSELQLIILAVSVLLMAALQLLVRRTRFGAAMRAVAENERAARILGINVERTILVTFAIASALGGAAGVLYSLAFNAANPDMGRAMELKGLAVIILGGMGSIPGAVLGGFILGLVEVMSVAITGQSSYRDAIAFAALFLILLIRPRGLFGDRAGREA
ncbi:MAG TPA: branched-chain amino acid ABC transporter permease [Chloroflexota bacterium]|jgi:branched-chain amino acid transport system permease protein|nr:branched-chain amino acid ABC transporter permease [Chloroflexota bacterium]